MLSGNKGIFSPYRELLPWVAKWKPWLKYRPLMGGIWNACPYCINRILSNFWVFCNCQSKLNSLIDSCLRNPFLDLSNFCSKTFYFTSFILKVLEKSNEKTQNYTHNLLLFNTIQRFRWPSKTQKFLKIAHQSTQSDAPKTITCLYSAITPCYQAIKACYRITGGFSCDFLFHH